MKYQRQLLIVGAMFFSTLIAFLLIDTFTGDRDTAKAYAEKLEKEINDLNSSIAEYRANTAEASNNLEITQLLLGEKHDELEHMNQQVRMLEANIAKLEKEGKTQRRTILAMKAKLAEVKEVLVQTYKAEINMLVGDLGELMRESEDMKLEKEQLQSTLKSIQSLYEECSNEKLEEIVEVAPDSSEQDRPGFYAMDVKVQAFDSEGRTINRGKSIRRNRLHEFLFTFTLNYGHPKLENYNPPEEIKTTQEFYLVLQHKRTKSVLYNSNSSNSGKEFTYKGKPYTSSLLIQVNFQESEVSVKGAMEFSDPSITLGAYDLFVFGPKGDGTTEIVGKGETFIH